MAKSRAGAVVLLLSLMLAGGAFASMSTKKVESSFLKNRRSSTDAGNPLGASKPALSIHDALGSLQNAERQPPVVGSPNQVVPRNLLFSYLLGSHRAASRFPLFRGDQGSSHRRQAGRSPNGKSFAKAAVSFQEQSAREMQHNRQMAQASSPMPTPPGQYIPPPWEAFYFPGSIDASQQLLPPSVQGPDWFALDTEPLEESQASGFYDGWQFPEDIPEQPSPWEFSYSPADRTTTPTPTQEDAAVSPTSTENLGEEASTPTPTEQPAAAAPDPAEDLILQPSLNAFETDLNIKPNANAFQPFPQDAEVVTTSSPNNLEAEDSATTDTPTELLRAN